MNLLELFKEYYQPAVFSFGLCVLLVFYALRLYPKWGLMDRPQKYGLNRSPIPYYGGLVIFLAFVISVLVFVPLSKGLVALLLGGLLITFIGFFDDFYSLSPWVRLFVQFLACILIIFGGVGILSINLPFLGSVNFTFWSFKGIFIASAIFTILWVMSIVNTMNFIDGVSGLSSGVGFIAGMTLFFLSTNPIINQDLAAQAPVAMISLVLAMVSLAFLIFDFPKPKILMGDTGSTFLGFVIASLAIFSGGKVATAFLVLGLPILDMLWVIFRRLFAGQKIWKGDLKHLHHRLLDFGLSDRKVVVLYLLITAIFGFGAVLLVSSQQKFFMMIALSALMLLLAIALVFSPRKN